MNSDILDDIGILGGTDKSCLRWDYLRQYQEVFRDWRDREFNLIELGVAGGASLNAWRRYFPRATVVGIDIEEGARRVAGDRIQIMIGSQADASFLDTVCEKYRPSIVVDDGSHQADHIMISFQAIFPWLTPGGWYVIEDLNITGSQDKVPLTPHAFFTQSALAMTNRRPGTHPEPAILAEIDRIDFAPGIVFVRKKCSEAQRQRLIRASNTVWQTTHPNNYLWLSEQLAAFEEHLHQAEEAAKRATELYPGHPIYHIGLSRIRQRRKDMVGAIDAAAAAIKADPPHFEHYYQLAYVLWEAGDAAGSAAAFEQSLAVAPSHLRVHIEDRRKQWT